ncbi:MAG: hypothetical protein EBW68_08090 [Actinobacteria bacterium]|nr:hypothetical protein [Actinomycetota bacterium]
MKVIRYLKELEDELGEPLNKWAVYEEQITSNGGWAFKDAKILKTFTTPHHARNWMENDSKRNY